MPQCHHLRRGRLGSSGSSPSLGRLGHLLPFVTKTPGTSPGQLVAGRAQRENASHSPQPAPLQEGRAKSPGMRCKVRRKPWLLNPRVWKRYSEVLIPDWTVGLWLGCGMPIPPPTAHQHLPGASLGGCAVGVQVASSVLLLTGGSRRRGCLP